MQNKIIPLFPDQCRLASLLAILVLSFSVGISTHAAEVSPDPADLRPVQTNTVGPAFFNLLDLSQPGLEQTAKLVKQQRYAEALNTWRDNWVAKIRPLTLAPHSGWESVPAQTNFADLLVGYRPPAGYNDIYGICSPPDQPRPVKWFAIGEEPHIFIDNCRCLEGRYQQTRDACYLRKWFAIFNDFAVNNKAAYVRLSETEKKALPFTYWNIGAGVVLSMSVQAQMLIKAIACFAKALPDGNPIRSWDQALNSINNPVAAGSTALIPADQLANIALCLIYDYGPILRKAYERSRPTPNQRLQGLLALALIGEVFKEFRPATALTTAANYGFADYLATTVYPDGGDLEQSFNYNGGLIGHTRSLLRMFPDPASVPPWLQQYRTAALKRQEMFAGLTLPVGGLPHVSSSLGLPPPLWNDTPERAAWKQKKFQDSDPWESAEAARIYDHLWGAGTGAVPAFISVAFPYSGYYALRKTWDLNSPYLFFSGQRRGSGHGDEMCNDVQVVAYGRVLLMAGAQDQYTSGFLPAEQRPDFWAINEYVGENSSYSHNTVIVDGYSQQRYIRGAVTLVYPDPIQSRWHTSAFFDLVEGSYADGYGGNVTNWRPTTVAGCRHDRQVIFLRSLDCWIVTDRLSNDGKKHEFTQLWHFPPSYDWNGAPQTGFRRNQVIFSQEERWIKTHDPAGPNVALFHYSSQPLHYTFHYGERNPYRGWYALGIGSVTPAVEMQASWKGLGDQLLVTLIEPRRTLGTGIIQKLTDCSANQQDGIAGFRAETSKGGTVTFLAAPTADRKDNVLEIGACRLNGEALLVFEQPGELTRGLVLGCQELTWMGKKQEVGETDFEFVVTNGTIQVAAPIRYPRAAEITAQPPAGLYADSVNVDLQYTGPVGGELRYTLDGSSPHSGATRYTGCLALTNTTTVKAQAFRRNQAVGNVATIRYQIVTLLPIRIAGKTYAKGLGLHAQADVRYVLQPEYKRFVAVAGVDDSTGYKGNMIFRVLADDKQLAESPVLSGAALRYWHFDCPLPAGARILRLVAVAAPNSGGYNMGDWVNAGFIKNK